MVYFDGQKANGNVKAPKTRSVSVYEMGGSIMYVLLYILTTKHDRENNFCDFFSACQSGPLNLPTCAQVLSLLSLTSHIAA